MAVSADVIKAAAGSTLGVLALMLMVLSTIALTFFRGASNAIKLTVFVVLTLGTAAFAAAVLHQTSQKTSVVNTVAAGNVAEPTDRLGVSNSTTVIANGDEATAIGTVNGNVSIRH